MSQNSEPISGDVKYTQLFKVAELLRQHMDVIITHRQHP